MVQKKKTTRTRKPKTETVPTTTVNKTEVVKKPKVETKKEEVETVEAVVVEYKKPVWRVISGGLSLHDGRSFNKDSGTFEAAEHEIPQAFRDIVICVTPGTEVRHVKKEKPQYKLRPVVGSAEEQDKDDYTPLFEIVDSKGKVVSEGPVAKAEAELQLKAMNE